MTFCDLALVRRKATKTSLMNIQTSWFGCTILPINSLCICQNNNVFLTTVWTIQVCLHNIFIMLTLLKKLILDNQEIHQYDCNLKLPPICIFHQYAWKSLWHNHSVHHLHSKYVQTQWLTWYASTRFFPVTLNLTFSPQICSASYLWCWQPLLYVWTLYVFPFSS